MWDSATYVHPERAVLCVLFADYDGTSQSTVALVFFITYTLFQPPATILMRFIGPRIFLAGLCVAWGVVMVSLVAYGCRMPDIEAMC